MYDAPTTAALTANLTGFALAAMHNNIAGHYVRTLEGKDTTDLLATIDRINWHRQQAAHAARFAS